MYETLYRKLKGDQPPFHQKVLRMNYAIPLGQVYQAAMHCLEAVHADEMLFLAPDFLECSQWVSRERVTAAKIQFYRAVFAVAVPMGQRYPGAWTGVFDAGEGWYLRLFAEDPEDVSQGEVMCGNFELYAPDEQLLQAKEAVAKTVEGHLLTEGAKGYLEEITEA